MIKIKITSPIKTVATFSNNTWKCPDAKMRAFLNTANEIISITPDIPQPEQYLADKILEVIDGTIIEYIPPEPMPAGTIR